MHFISVIVILLLYCDSFSGQRSGIHPALVRWKIFDKIKNLIFSIVTVIKSESNLWLYYITCLIFFVALNKSLNDRRTDIWCIEQCLCIIAVYRYYLIFQNLNCRSQCQICLQSLCTEMAWTGRNHRMSRLRWVDWAVTNFSDIHNPISPRTNLTDYHIHWLYT